MDDRIGHRFDGIDLGRGSKDDLILAYRKKLAGEIEALVMECTREEVKAVFDHMSPEAKAAFEIFVLQGWK